MDNDGCADEEDLAKIRAWPYTDFVGLMAFVKSMWWNADWGWTEHTENNLINWNLSTGGWGENEGLIAAMHANQMFWSLCWQSSRRGGHYEFDLTRLIDPQTPGSPRTGT